VSALSHYIEDEGVPTVAISLIRPHSERIANPRSLWVPFELGRPLGPPGDAAFQSRVLRAALALLETAGGPVVLRDFEADDPTAADRQGWAPPFDLPPPPDTGDRAALEPALLREVSAVAPAHARFAAANAGRSTVGISGLGIEACAAHFAKALSGALPPSAIPDMAPAQFLRFVVDDLKAFYLEAASAGPDIPSSRQIQAWFWDRTALARAVIALRGAMIASEDARAQAIGRLNLVPGVQAARLKLT
jgi:hypothetical protein